MVTFAKGVTSGYLPLGGVVVSGRVAEPFWSRPGNMVRHGATYAGHPVCCAAALANLDILESEGLIARGAELEDDLAEALEPLTAHALVEEVRAGTGLLAAVQLTAEAIAGGLTPADLLRRCREGGMLVRPLANAVAVSPPLTITTEELQLIGVTLREALDAALVDSGAPVA
jgi:adenosylmethionine-8-amino-7-oxononanoate aminotransferase